MNSYLELAYKASAQSTHPKHQMAAVVVKGGCVLAVAHNLDRWGACCERRALRPHQDMAGATIVVVRRNGGISRPCSYCWQAIREAGLKKVVYTDRQGNIQVEKV